jgi:hypothetical protein
MGFEGAVTFRPPLAWEKAGRFMCWPMLKPCVTEPSEINVTCKMLVASGVPTKNDWPYATLVGADVIVGREPRNR